MIKAEDITKRLAEVEQRMTKAEERRQKHQRLLDHAFSKAGQAQATQAPSLKSQKEQEPVSTRRFLGGGKITTLAWTQEKRCIQNQYANGRTETKWISNKWRPR